MTVVLRPAAAAQASADPFLAGVDVRVGQVCDRDFMREAGLEGERFDAFVSCIASRTGASRDAWRIDYQANEHLLTAARACGAESFVLLSAICVQRPVLAFQQAKLAFEAQLQASGLRWSIVRPTAYFKSLAGQLPRVKAGKPFLLFGLWGDGPACVPISEADTARFMADCLSEPSLANRILPIGGPGPAVTPHQRGDMLFALAGRAPRYRRIPLTIFDGLIPLLTIGGRVSPALQRGSEFARIGRFYAREPMLVRDAYGIYSASSTPRYGQDTLADFYARVWKDGLAGQELKEQSLFD